MADLTIHELQNEATAPANDDYLVLDGATAGTRKTLSSTFAAWIHNKWAAFVNALTAKTSFASGDKIPVVNGSTGTAMDASKLLELTAQNALADNVAPAFDSTRTIDNPYVVGNRVVYGGILYKFKNEHYGDWAAGDVERVTDDELIDEQNLSIVQRTSPVYVTERNCFVIDGKEIKASDGSLVNSESYKTSNLIFVPAGTTLVYSLKASSTNSAKIAKYTTNGKFVSALVVGDGSEFSGGIITFNDDCCVRISTKASAKATIYFNSPITPESREVLDESLSRQSLAMIDGLWNRCGGVSGSEYWGNAHRLIAYGIVFPKNTIVNINTGFRLYYGGSWRTGTLEITAGTYDLSIARVTEDTTEVADFEEYLSAVSVFQEDVYFEQRFTQVSKLPITPVVGYYPSNGQNNASLSQDVCSFGMIPVKKGCVVKINDVTTGLKIEGVRAFLYDRDVSYIKTIGNYSTDKQIAIDQDCFILISVNTTFADAHSSTSEIANSVWLQSNLLDYDTLYKTYSSLPVTFEQGSLDKGKPVESTSAARSSLVYMPKGSSIFIQNNLWYIIIHVLDQFGKNWYQTLGGTAPASRIINKFTATENCWVKLVVRPRDSSVSVDAAAISQMPNYFIFNIAQTTEDVLPPYYYENDYIQGKVDDINAMDDTCGFNGDMFAFITDTHWSTQIARRSPLLLEYIKNRTSITRCFFGGDADNTEGTNADIRKDYYEFRKAFSLFSGDKWLPIIGNHEYWSETMNHQDVYAMVVKESEQFFKVYGELLYTFTNERAKIVYIMLSCASKANVFTAEQLTQFGEALDDVPTGYSVVVFTHGAITLSNQIDTNFAPFYTELESRKAGGMDVICVLCGHIHDDLIYSGGTVPIASTTSDGGVQGGVLVKTVGTITEQVFDIVCIDKTLKRVYLKRIGAGEDRQFDY